MGPRLPHRVAVFVGSALVASTAWAQPLPVIAVAVGERPAPAALVARAASVAGPDARSGDALAASLTGRFGRFPPAGDPLRAARAEAVAAARTFFSHSPSSARRRLAPAAQAMTQQREALELVEENRAAYVQALLLLGRVDLDGRDPASADGWFRRAIELDPAWAPSPDDWPPPVVERYLRLRPPGAPAPDAPAGTVAVRTPREGCQATVDGRPAPATVRPGLHRVMATCGQPSRVRVVEVRPGANVTVTVDPRLDRALELAGTVALRYAGAEELAAQLASDAAAVGAELGARRVLAVGADAVRVIDVASGRATAEVPADAGDLEARLRAALSGEPTPATPVAPLRPLPVPVTERGPGVGPWVVAGAGAAAVVAGAVLLALSVDEFGTVERLCGGADGGALRCNGLDEGQRAEASASYDRARAFNTAGWVAAGVGGAALVGGVLWYALAPRGGAAPRVQAGLAPGGAAVRAEWRF